VTDGLERGCKISEYGLILNVCLTRIRIETEGCEEGGDRNPLIAR